MSSNNFICSTSWKPPWPIVLLAACGVTNNNGVWFQYAVFTAVTKFVIPGPFCAIIMDISPVARVYPSAIIPADPSCAQSQNLMPACGNKSEIGIMAEPMIPNACSIPCICRTFTNASSVVIFMNATPDGRVKYAVFLGCVLV